MGFERCVTCRLEEMNPGKMICDRMFEGTAEYQLAMANLYGRDDSSLDVDEAFRENDKELQFSSATLKRYLRDALGCKLSDEAIKHNVDFLKQDAQGV